MPTIGELRSLVYCSSGAPTLIGMPSDRTECQGTYDRPTIVGWAFPNTPSDWFWSSSPGADSSDGAWFVNFYYGGVSYYYKNFAKYVRLVRGGQ